MKLNKIRKQCNYFRKLKFLPYKSIISLDRIHWKYLSFIKGIGFLVSALNLQIFYKVSN